MNFRDAIVDYAEQPITKQILFDLLKDYRRPYDKINELVKQGMLIPVKRGIYVTGSYLKVANSEAFLLANHLLRPSYVSMESALSHWGLIPEKVFEISSVTTQSSKVFNTAVGRFSYTKIPLPYYSFGIQQVALTKKQTTLVASPEKALCDKIVTTAGILLRSSTQVMELLSEDLRIEKDRLQRLDTKKMRAWVKDAPKKNSLEMLVKTLGQL
jgi:predicted transcriptional regulator of viral defense system